jgi:hypothetical protein
MTAPITPQHRFSLNREPRNGWPFAAIYARKLLQKYLQLKPVDVRARCVLCINEKLIDLKIFQSFK